MLQFNKHYPFLDKGDTVMKKILAFILMAAILTVPALASGEPATSAEPAAAVQESATNRVTVEVTAEATCTEKGLLTYTLTDGSTLEVETAPTGHTASAPAPTCTEPVVCTVCGDILAPAAGHAYTYQYDAVQNEDGTFAEFGTWKCDNCGDILAATEGNAVYYYGQQEEAGASGEASAEEAVQAAVISNPNYDPDAHNWASIEIVMAIVIVAVLAVLMLSFGKKRED